MAQGRTIEHNKNGVTVFGQIERTVCTAFGGVHLTVTPRRARRVHARRFKTLPTHEIAQRLGCV